MAKYGNSYSGNSFEEWYKNHYGSSYDGSSTNLSKDEDMTDEDLAIGKQLLSNYQNQNKIESDYETSSKSLLNYLNSGTEKLNEEKRSAQQNAYITYEKLKKYLPQQLKLQGLGGLGTSESALLQAYNNYNTTMGGISSTHSQRVSELVRAYNDKKAALDLEKRDMLYKSERDANGNLLVDNVINKYAEAQEKEREALYNDSVLPQFLSEIEAKTGIDGKISQSDYGELNKFVEDKKSEIGDAYSAHLYTELKNLEKYIRDEKKPTVRSDITLKGKANTANGNMGDNFEIQYDGISYKVEKGYNASEEIKEELSNAYKDNHDGADPKIGSVMLHGGKIYMYLHNNVNGGDTWSIIQGRALNQNSFIDLCSKLGISSYSRNKREDLIKHKKE